MVFTIPVTLLVEILVSKSHQFIRAAVQVIVHIKAN